MKNVQSLEVLKQGLFKKIEDGHDLSDLSNYVSMGLNLKKASIDGGHSGLMYCAIKNYNIPAIKKLREFGVEPDKRDFLKVQEINGRDMNNYFIQNFPNDFIKVPKDSNSNSNSNSNSDCIVYLSPESYEYATKKRDPELFEQLIKLKIKPNKSSIIKTAIDNYDKNFMDYLLGRFPSIVNNTISIHYNMGAMSADRSYTPSAYSLVKDNPDAFEQILKKDGKSLLEDKFQHIPSMLHIKGKTNVLDMILSPDSNRYWVENLESREGIRKGTFKDIAEKYLLEKSQNLSNNVVKESEGKDKSKES